MTPDSYSIDLGPMGAIGEQSSLMLRINRNCPWNRCLFCDVYKGTKFEYRDAAEIKRDIDVIRFLVNELGKTSLEQGIEGEGYYLAMQAMVQKFPDIYDNAAAGEAVLRQRYASLSNMCRWLSYGASTVFLQDSDALIMRSPELTEVIRYLKASFPSITRVSAYARSKTCAHRSIDELIELHEAGLSRLLVGIESGCNPVLEYMQKGVTADDHIEGGRKVTASGISLITFVMPGLGGRCWSQSHITETVRVLNEIQPNLIRIRSLAVQEGSPLYDKWQCGEFESPTDDEMVDEIEELVNGLNFECEIETGQLTNILFEISGLLPQDRDNILEIIREYRAKPPKERLNWRLNRYLYYYLPYIKRKGEADHQLLELIGEAHDALAKDLPGMETKVENAIFAIKQRGVP